MRFFLITDGQYIFTNETDEFAWWINQYRILRFGRWTNIDHLNQCHKTYYSINRFFKQWRVRFFFLFIEYNRFKLIHFETDGFCSMSADCRNQWKTSRKIFKHSKGGEWAMGAGPLDCRFRSRALPPSYAAALFHLTGGIRSAFVEWAEIASSSRSSTVSTS